MSVIGVSNEVLDSNGKFMGYLFFGDADTFDYRKVEKMALYLSDIVTDVVILKTKNGYHILSLNIFTDDYFTYAKFYLEMEKKFGVFDKNHISIFVRDGRNILRVSSRFRDRIVYKDYINNGYESVSGIHYLILKSIYKIDLEIKPDRILNTRTVIEKYKRGWFK